MVLIHEKNYKKVETTLFSTNSTKESLALDDTRNYEQGFTISTGINKGKMMAEIRYEKGNGMSKIVSLKSATHRLYILLGYTF